MTPPSISLYRKIGLSIHSTYQFIGYKSSILRYLIDEGDVEVNGKNAEGFTVQVQIGDVAKSATELITNQLRGGALGVAGGVVSAVDMMNNVLDGLSVADMVRNMAPDGGGITTLKRPGRANYIKDHALNGRIIMDITLHKGKRARWMNTELAQTDLKSLAYVLAAS